MASRRMIKPMHAVVITALVIAAIALSSRDFLEIDVPVTRHQGGGEFWWESHRTELALEDSAGKYYVYRQVGTGYADSQGWKTEAEVFAYFDKRLAERGWSMTSTGGSDPAVPESRLLPSESIHRYYRFDDAHAGSPYAIVVTWPIGSGVDGFNVVLTTVQPSLWKQFWSGLD
jgi:hypothetical protein